MAGEAVSFGATQEFKPREEEKKIMGVTICTVVDSVDCNGSARVQLSLPWLPGFQPWARLANQSAGTDHGSYFVPQAGTEVLVAFNHGDVREPYVLGSLYNTIDSPPADDPNDALNKRKIRTPVGHELEFDDDKQSVTLTSNMKSKVVLDADKVEVSTPKASITLKKGGDVTIKSSTKLVLDAPTIEIKAGSRLKVSSQGSGSVRSGGKLSIKGATVSIN